MINRKKFTISNPIEKALELASIRKDISERQEIVDKYYNTRHLDRDKAISKIRGLRITNENIAAVTAAKIAQCSVPFSQMPNENIVGELKMQVDILVAELIKNADE